jgi:hypothetical protein
MATEKYFRQAVRTRYIGPGNVRGSRIVARSSSGHSLTLTWDDSLNSDENHRAGAKALVRKLGWDEHDTYVGGAFGADIYWVCDNGPTTT